MILAALIVVAFGCFVMVALSRKWDSDRFRADREFLAARQRAWEDAVRKADEQEEEAVHSRRMVNLNRT